ncbi:MAG TPA: DUF3048 domain-containing protein [Candidatus Saccharimonadales bacterium]|nr:DUF3048 domain-containing protein [Candidatus Saccharimonadales bacterium]
MTPKSDGDKFVTPEAAAAADDLKTSAPVVSSPESTEEKSGFKLPFNLSYQFKWPPSKIELAALTGAAFVLIMLGWFIFGSGHSGEPKFKTKKPVVAKVAPKPTTVPSTLSGLPVDPSANQRPVTGVMVENSLDARPQSGLSQAGVVFEAVAEGGITRFLALYQDQVPTNVGPVRSARPYYIQWNLGFDAAYAHVGGSPDALNDISAWGVKDLNQFYNGGSYHRVSSRPAPHNVYTGIDTLNQLEAAKGYTSSNFTGFVRKKAAPAKKPTATSVALNMSYGNDYNVSYTYVPKTNSYARNEGGQAQIDANTNQQLSPTVVIAMVVPLGQGALDASGAYYSDYAVVGSGTVYVFQDGGVTTGTWSKADNNSQIQFTTASGQPLALDPGQAWLTAIPDASKVSYH